MKATLTSRTQTAAQFFYKQAGYGYDPKTETKEQGRRRGAKALAEAEAYASREGWDVRWSQDGSMYGQQGDCFDIVDDPDSFGDPLFVGWDAFLVDMDGNVLGSLGATTFAGSNGGDPWSDPYRRVVEAELALEAMPEKAVAS
jgi:hypothetical protein